MDFRIFLLKALGTLEMNSWKTYALSSGVTLYRTELPPFKFSSGDFFGDHPPLNPSLFPVVYWTQNGSRGGRSREILGLGGENSWKLLSTLPSASPIPQEDPLAVLSDVWAQDPRCPFFVHLPFAGSGKDATEWEPYRHFPLVLPFLYLEWNKEKNMITGSLSHLSSSDAADEISHQLRQILDEWDRPLPVTPATLPPSPGRVTFLPDRAGWKAGVEACLERMEQSASLRKVVLARKVILSYGEEVSSLALLRKLKEGKEDSFLFYFSPRPGTAFLGKTPERLFYREGPLLHSEALAGTRPRGRTPEEDQHYLQDLMTSEKEKREQEIVIDFILGAMGDLCLEPLHQGPREVLQLSHLQHLHTLFKGRLKAGLSLNKICRTLHPTPAVGGWPVKEALTLLAEQEPFSRGLYAAPLGWCDGHEAEFLVGIRSALVEGSRVHLFAGAGIVPGSRPEQEWIETENKMKNFLPPEGPS